MQQQLLEDYGLSAELRKGQRVKFPVTTSHRNNCKIKPVTIWHAGVVKEVTRNGAVIRGVTVPGLYNRPRKLINVNGGRS